MEALKSTPIELVEHILEYTLECKKEENIIINKNLVEKFKEKQKRCSYKNIWGHTFCRKCDKDELDYIKYLRIRFLFGPTK